VRVRVRIRVKARVRTFPMAFFGTSSTAFTNLENTTSQGKEEARLD
jgi:hypothetical protein